MKIMAFKKYSISSQPIYQMLFLKVKKKKVIYWGVHSFSSHIPVFWLISYFTDTSAIFFIFMSVSESFLLVHQLHNGLGVVFQAYFCYLIVSQMYPFRIG